MLVITSAFFSASALVFILSASANIEAHSAKMAIETIDANNIIMFNAERAGLFVVMVFIGLRMLIDCSYEPSFKEPVIFCHGFGRRVAGDAASLGWKCPIAPFLSSAVDI